MSKPQHHAQPMQPQPGGESRLKKIEWYASQLVTEAISKEKSGKPEEAVVNYLQAADLLLLLAKGQQDYTRWKELTERAGQCQQRVRMLVAARSSRDS